MKNNQNYMVKLQNSDREAFPSLAFSGCQLPSGGLVTLINVPESNKDAA